MPLKPKRCDEDVDEDSEEDKDRRHIVHSVQLGVFPHVVQIILHCWHTIAQEQKLNELHVCLKLMSKRKRQT